MTNTNTNNHFVADDAVCFGGDDTENCIVVDEIDILDETNEDEECDAMDYEEEWEEDDDYVPGGYCDSEDYLRSSGYDADYLDFMSDDERYQLAYENGYRGWI